MTNSQPRESQAAGPAQAPAPHNQSSRPHRPNTTFKAVIQPDSEQNPMSKTVFENLLQRSRMISGIDSIVLHADKQSDGSIHVRIGSRWRSPSSPEIVPSLTEISNALGKAFGEYAQIAVTGSDLTFSTTGVWPKEVAQPATSRLTPEQLSRFDASRAASGGRSSRSPAKEVKTPGGSQNYRQPAIVRTEGRSSDAASAIAAKPGLACEVMINRDPGRGHIMKADTFLSHLGYQARQMGLVFEVKARTPMTNAEQISLKACFASASDIPDIDTVHTVIERAFGEQVDLRRDGHEFDAKSVYPAPSGDDRYHYPQY